MKNINSPNSKKELAAYKAGVESTDLQSLVYNVCYFYSKKSMEQYFKNPILNLLFTTAVPFLKEMEHEFCESRSENRKSTKTGGK
jgi:hypothetical protein